MHFFFVRSVNKKKENTRDETKRRNRTQKIMNYEMTRGLVLVFFFLLSFISAFCLSIFINSRNVIFFLFAMYQHTVYFVSSCLPAPF